MKRFLITAIGTAAALAAPAQAGIYADDLTRCVVGKTTPADQTAIMQWLFSALAASPVVQEMAKVSSDQHARLNGGMTTVIQRLILKDCRPQAVAAMKYEGAGALQQSFELVGRVAVQNLMSDPSVVKQLQSLDASSDRAAFAALAKEAGLPVPAEPSGGAGGAK